MAARDALYYGVSSVLEKYNEDLKAISNHIISLKQNYHDGCSSADKLMREQLEKNEKLESKLKAFIGIARAHSNHLVKADQKFPIDISLLSRLHVQIDNNSQNDQYAAKLFTQATGQLATCEQSRSQIEKKCETTRAQLLQTFMQEKKDYEQQQIEHRDSLSTYLKSDVFNKFIQSLYEDFSRFGSKNVRNNTMSEDLQSISIGTKQIKLNIPTEFAPLIKEKFNKIYDVYNQNNSQIGIPVSIDLTHGSGTIIDYTNETENSLLSGLQNFLFNIAHYCDNLFDQIVFIDPIRFNKSSLGIMESLSAGKNPFIDNVPLSFDEIREKIDSIIANLNADERKKATQEGIVFPKRVLIFHGFPQSYDSATINQIQQLFVNATYYNITIIATHNTSSKNSFASDVVSYIRSIANSIGCQGNAFYISDTRNSVPFRWYEAPHNIPNAILDKCLSRNMVNISSEYESCVGFDFSTCYKKSVRQLRNIPYGIDEQGNVLTLDFEGSNYATFICGASGSGKSTLLHTIITGILKNNHPDDVELWLVDFKMIEFSRYVHHCPPHIRYIILDESPELVYDLIDRLTEILIKRQNAFKGKWLKLDDVPPEKYMPAILVIIDEFSIISQIVANSITYGKEDYKEKLQILLAKGRGLGLHFIFSSQAFTSGSRGLTPFSKEQIQQRIAMKTEYSEIKETLDLKSSSDFDKSTMEQLPVHHALVRIPVDDKGNHLQLAKVLYISEDTKQLSMIDTICHSFVSAPRYEVNNPTIYIDKQTTIVDGNRYVSFISQKSKMEECLHKNKSDILNDEDDTALFLGQPIRMRKLNPIKVINEFGENILVLSPLNEKMPAISLIMSIMASLEMQMKNIVVWATRRNPIYRQMRVAGGQHYFSNVSQDLDNICCEIHKLKKLIQSKTYGDDYIFLFGVESLLIDMSYQQQNQPFSSINRSHTPAEDVMIAKRAPNEMDILSQLKILSEGNDTLKNPVKNDNSSQPALVNIKYSSEWRYDARSDLKFILTQGPRLGYHFIVVFNTVGELNQSKFDLNFFKHKILFRLPKTDVISVVGSATSNVVSELKRHSFRYTNGLDSISFRPYLHEGLYWDGWKMDNGLEANRAEEEEYLM